MTAATAPVPLPQAEVDALERRFPAREVALTQGGVVAVREAGQGAQGLPLVCLHGIGSGSASWLGVADALDGGARLIAWDAPGYGASTPVTRPAPCATDYAARLGGLLDTLGIERCVLVGHSLGALMAGGAVHAGAPLAGRIARLVLMSPARGYGAVGREVQAQKVRTERLATLDQLGIAGMASQRSGRLVSDNASERARQWVRWNMGRLHEAGYRQAVELLTGDDLLAYLPPAMPVQVLCGSEDVVTTPLACGEVARACGVELALLPGAGHACYVEQPEPVARLLLAAAQEQDA
ncbi:alpha/beta fold hydrolase [Pseudacidovorax intermedius]|uniref:alpha/beta fold hydrolase n=1 Tax=Pseudacidovorax intermedius TaxID=433924 RepID=UPI0003490A1B|nr:alpha/beta fold hydrolase [Pseudacidovorax intermedius]